MGRSTTEGRTRVYVVKGLPEDGGKIQPREGQPLKKICPTHPNQANTEQTHSSGVFFLVIILIK